MFTVRFKCDRWRWVPLVTRSIIEQTHLAGFTAFWGWWGIHVITRGG